MVMRNPDVTRGRLLQAAFEEFYRYGFRAASLDRILSNTGLTKGALYHHFPNKAELGYAVVDEIIRGYVVQEWVRPVHEDENPIDAIVRTLRGRSPRMVENCCEMGCPLNNLAQEMSPIDDTFRRKVAAVVETWRNGIAERLKRGQQGGHVRKDIDCVRAALFIVASIEGSSGLAKNSQDPEVLDACVDGLCQYLESLRASSQT